MATYQMYRNTTVGQALQRTLDDFVQDGMIPAALAQRVLASFDKSINRTLTTKAKNKVFFRAEKLRAYRFCDNVWTFLMEHVTFREGVDQPTGRVKIVACDGSATKLAAAAAPPTTSA